MTSDEGLPERLMDECGDAGLQTRAAPARTTYERILDTMERAARHPLGVAGLMIMDEIKAGRVSVQPGSAWPFNFIEADWHTPAVVSHDGREVRIVAIQAASPGNGAFRRLIDNISAAGLSPVVCEPVGVVMPAIMKRWGWRGRTVGSGDNRVNEWRPAVARGHSTPRLTDDASPGGPETSSPLLNVAADPGETHGT